MTTRGCRPSVIAATLEIAHLDGDFGHRLAFGDFGHGPMELVACTELHSTPPFGTDSFRGDTELRGEPSRPTCLAKAGEDWL